MSDAGLTQDDVVQSELRDGVWRVVLNDPGARNAIGARMGQGLQDALAAMPDEARALYLTGTADSFCAGANLAEGLGRLDDPNRDLGARLDTVYHPSLDHLKKAQVPVIVGVNGPAVGIGLSFAQMGDLIIAAQSSYFALGFGKIALVPDGGATWFLPRVVGRARAMRMYMENAKIYAEEALQWGLATHVLPDEGFQDAAFAMAVHAARGPTKAIAMTRQAYWDGLSNTHADQLAVEMRLQTEAGRGPDFVEGLKAFIEKRQPEYTGK